MATISESLDTRFIDRAVHRHWLISEALSLIRLYQRSAFNPAGGFFTLSTDGSPLLPAQNGGGAVRQLHDTTRMVHCFAVARLLGLPGAARFVDHGMRFLLDHHHDCINGGYYWAVDDKQPVDSEKQAYGHAFVMLAASSAHVAGHPDGKALFDDVMAVLLKFFWDDEAGATTEEYTADWQPLGDYRGQNSNMHLTEALMAAFEAFGDIRCLHMAERISELVIHKHAKGEDWRVAEHFTAEWEVDKHYKGDPIFRPSGTTPGHSLEWSRLLIQLWETGDRKQEWMPEAAKSLFSKTVSTAWDKDNGGFYYTLGWNDQPDQRDRYWWPCAEGIGAAAALAHATNGHPDYEYWYRTIWSFVNTHVIDPVHGGWFPELDSDLQPRNTVFVGKPDLYHALQACLIPLLPGNGSITRGLMTTDIVKVILGPQNAAIA